MDTKTAKYVFTFLVLIIVIPSLSLQRRSDNAGNRSHYSVAPGSD